MFWEPSSEFEIKKLEQKVGSKVPPPKRMDQGENIEDDKNKLQLKEFFIFAWATQNLFCAISNFGRMFFSNHGQPNVSREWRLAPWGTLLPDGNQCFINRGWQMLIQTYFQSENVIRIQPRQNADADAHRDFGYIQELLELYMELFPESKIPSDITDPDPDKFFAMKQNKGISDIDISSILEELDIALGDSPRSELKRTTGVSRRDFETARKELNKLLKNNPKTNGWVIFENSNAWSGEPGKYGHEQKDMKNKTDIERRRFCIEHDIYGFVSSTGPGLLSGYAWCRDQAKNPDDLINHIETDKRETHAKSSVHISPGASISLIEKKIKKGYKVVFEDKSDENKIKNISGYKKKKKKTRKKKQSRKKKSKKKKSKRKKSKRYKIKYGL
jgi:hypothetical protein